MNTLRCIAIIALAFVSGRVVAKDLDTDEHRYIIGTFVDNVRSCGRSTDSAVMFKFSRKQFMDTFGQRCKITGVKNAGDEWAVSGNCASDADDKYADPATYYVKKATADGDLLHVRDSRKPSDPDSVSWKLNRCPAPSKQSPARAEAQPRSLIGEWNDANNGCRGGAGNDPKTDEACKRRDGLDKRLEAMGYCIGDYGNMKTREKWFPCKKARR